MEILLLLVLLISFVVTVAGLPSWIKRAKKMDLVWKDMNKYQKTKVAGSGGIVVILGFLLSILLYVALKTFYFQSATNIVEIFAMLTSILILAGIGIVDDLMGWYHGGLSKKFRIFLCFFAAIPFMVIGAGYSDIGIPYLGIVSLGLLYPLIVIPLGIVGASTTFNFLAGFNGLEAGQGILILGALSVVAAFTGSSWVAIICLCMVLALLAFLIFNKFPARVFPGDVLTYPVGGLIAIVAILGNFEKIAIFFFIPYIIETLLKIRGRLKIQSFGKPNGDGSLEMPEKRVYGLEHSAILFLKKFRFGKKAYEKDVVYLIWLFQAIIIVLGFLLFRNSIF